jgi:hypothetical protein
VPKKPEQGAHQGKQRRPFSHETNLRRNVDTRREQRVILIVTNGKKTEKDYFEAINEESWVAASNIQVKFKNGSPAAAVKYAINEAGGYTETWVVCDVDHYDTTLAIASARRYGVFLALSRPSFEVWLILHLFEGCSPFDNALQAGVRLTELLPTWDKTELNFDDFRAGVLEAEKRARRLTEIYGEPPVGNPSTDVWKIIESLRSTPTEQ